MRPRGAVESMSLPKPRAFLRLSGERFVDNLRLLLLVAPQRPGGGTGPLRPADVAQRSLAIIENRLQILLHKPPGAHVARLFLHPRDFSARGVIGKARFDPRGRERVQLLHPHHRYLVRLVLLPRGNQIVGELTATEYDAS